MARQGQTKGEAAVPASGRRSRHVVGHTSTLQSLVTYDSVCRGNERPAPARSPSRQKRMLDFFTAPVSRVFWRATVSPFVFLPP